MQDWRLSILFVAFGLSAVIGIIRVALQIWEGFHNISGLLCAKIAGNRVQITIVIFVILSYVIWLDLFRIYRYLVPVEALSGVGLIVAMASIFRRHPAPLLGILAAATIVANVFIVRPDMGHVAYGDHVIEIGPIPIAPGSLVVIADDRPHGYLVPFLPRDARVIAIYANFIRPGQSHGLNRRMAELLRSHSGPIATISSAATPEADLKDRSAQYGLWARDCVIVHTNMEETGQKICQAFR